MSVPTNCLDCVDHAVVETDRVVVTCAPDGRFRLVADTFSRRVRLAAVTVTPPDECPRRGEGL